MKKRKKNDGYSVIVESANPHKLATASMPKDEFDALCRKEIERTNCDSVNSISQKN